MDAPTGSVSYEDSVKFSNATVGHRFLAPKPFKVKDFADYVAKLRNAYVVLDQAERRDIIGRQAETLAKKHRLTLKPDKRLLDEVAGLVEWPVVLTGRIDKAFMSLPPEVLTTAMRHHQKYFSLLDKKGAMAPRFIVVANSEAPDGGKAIVAGNERVLRARLADARFFWDQDRKRRLEDRLPDLAERVFHAKLGSEADKVERVRKLATALAARIPGADEVAVERAAMLCKADLSTDMVGEFPELQGVMGRYYALGDNEAPEVADAIADHYSPMGPGDRCPTAPVSVAVSLADKIDTLVGFWLVGQKPTGSGDPFALRRAAIGVIRLLLENQLRLPLKAAFDEARKTFRGGLAGHATPKPPPVEAILADLLGFFADRLKVHLREKGVRHDLIDAVFALGGEDDLVRLMTRVEALGQFLMGEDGEHLLTAYKRAANIVRIEEKRDGERYDGGADASLLDEDEERALFEGLAEVHAESAPAIAAEEFAGAMSALARLRAPVDAFFDQVTVNCDDPVRRANRLHLLSQIRATMNRLADFSRIEGGEH